MPNLTYMLGFKEHGRAEGSLGAVWRAPGLEAAQAHARIQRQDDFVRHYESLMGPRRIIPRFRIRFPPSRGAIPMS